MSRCLKTCVSGKLSSQTDKRNGKGWGAMLINATTKEETLSDYWDIMYQPECAFFVRGIHTSATVGQLFISDKVSQTFVAGNFPSYWGHTRNKSNSAKTEELSPLYINAYVWNKLDFPAELVPCILTSTIGPKCRLAVVVCIKNQGLGHFSCWELCFFLKLNVVPGRPVWVCEVVMS